MSKRGGEKTFVPHKDFMDLLAIAWHKDATEANVHAVLKRTAVMVNSRQYLYWRLPGAAAARVPRIPLGDKLDFLREDSRAVYDAYRKGSKSLPVDFASSLKWEADWMEAAMGGARSHPPVPWTVRTMSTAAGAPNGEASSSAPATPAAEVKVKQEQRAVFTRLAKTAHKTSIDLCSPSPAKKQRTEEVDQTVERNFEDDLDRELSQLIAEGEAVASRAPFGDEGLEEDVFGHGCGLD